MSIGSNPLFLGLARRNKYAKVLKPSHFTNFTIFSTETKKVLHINPPRVATLDGSYQEFKRDGYFVAVY